MTLITSFYLCIGTHPGQLDMSLSSWTKGSCGEMGVVSMLNPAPRYHGAFYKVWRRKGSIIDAPHHHLTYLTWYPRFPSCTEGCSTAQWVWSVNSLSCRQTRSFKKVAWDFYCVWWGCFAIKSAKNALELMLGDDAFSQIIRSIDISKNLPLTWVWTFIKNCIKLYLVNRHKDCSSGWRNERGFSANVRDFH